MEKKTNITLVIPVLFGFFIQGFCDIVGITSDYAASAFGWSPAMTGLIPSAVFIWFFFLGIPAGLVMNKIGRKNTVLLSMGITVVGMALPLIHYDYMTTLAAFALLGIGNAIMQVSQSPLLKNVISDEKLFTSAVTAGQVVKALSSFTGPFIVVIAVAVFGRGDDQMWYYCFPIMGAITLIVGVWLLFTPIEREESQAKVSSVGGTLALLKDKVILMLFVGIFFAVATDVSTNFISSKILISRFDYSKEAAGIAPQIYFVCRTIGAFIGMFVMARMSDVKYFRLNIIACIAVVLGLAFVDNYAFDMFCIGAIGFLCSCVFPIIYSMAVNRRPDKANEISGLMIMAVSGGTVSFLVGAAINSTGITGGVMVILACVLYLTFCALMAKSSNTSKEESEHEALNMDAKSA